jgi:DNA-binding response OmpR family regulator
MGKAKILVVDDSEAALLVAVTALNSDYIVDQARSGEEAIAKAKSNSYEVIVLDLGLPDLDGYKVCSRLRNDGIMDTTSIIVVSGRLDVDDKMMAFSLGASDYMTKPADARELKARVKLAIEKANSSNKDNFKKGPFHLHWATLSATVCTQTGDVELSLSPQEFKLLHYLLQHNDHVLTRQQILEHVWGGTRNVLDRSVDALLSKLRRKVEPFGAKVSAVHGMGYRFRLVGLGTGQAHF